MPHFYVNHIRYSDAPVSWHIQVMILETVNLYMVMSPFITNPQCSLHTSFHLLLFVQYSLLFCLQWESTTKWFLDYMKLVHAVIKHDFMITCEWRAEHLWMSYIPWYVLYLLPLSWSAPHKIVSCLLVNVFLVLSAAVQGTVSFPGKLLLYSNFSQLASYKTTN
jgi:hypothetical protein